MHVSGHWSAWGAMLERRLAPSCTRSRQMDADTVLDVVDREQVTMLTIVGDSMGRPIVEAIEARSRPPRHLVGAHARIRGEHHVRRREGPALRRLPVGHGADRGHRLVRVARPGALDHRPGPGRRPRPPVQRRRPDDRVRRPPSSGVARIGGGGAVGHQGTGAASATTRTPRSRPAPSSPSTASAGRSRATWPPSRPTARIRLLGRGTMCINTGGEKVYPEEVEAVLKAHPPDRRRRRGRGAGPPVR